LIGFLHLRHQTFLSHLHKVKLILFLCNKSIDINIVIFPPPSSSSIPKPSIPVGLKTELQQYPSISLVLPVQSEPINNQKIVSDSEDTLYQQEGLSIKGMCLLLSKLQKIISYFSFNQVVNKDIYYHKN
jgi:hypothetical protein